MTIQDFRNQYAGDQRLLSPEDAARYLDLSTNYLAKLRCWGGGPKFAKINSRIRYPRDELDHWIAECLRASTSEDAHA